MCSDNDAGRQTETDTELTRSKRNTLLVTDGRGSLKSSVTSVWGPKALEGVQDVNLTLEVQIDRVMAKREGVSDG